MLAITAATNAGKSRVGPAASEGATPCEGELTMTVRPASAPAMIQTRREIRRQGMPTSRARSGFSASERMATPESVRARYQPRAKGSAITTPNTRRSFPSKSTGRMNVWKRESGVAKEPTKEGPPSHPGTNDWIPPNTWAKPMVATMTISRGTRWKRHRSKSSVATPKRAPVSHPDHQGQVPVPVLAEVEHQPHRAGKSAHGPVGEIDDPVGSVGQDEAQREETR